MSKPRTRTWKIQAHSLVTSQSQWETESLLRWEWPTRNPVAGGRGLEFPRILQAGPSQCKLTVQTPQYTSVPSHSSMTQGPQGFTSTHRYQWHSVGFPCCLIAPFPFLPGLNIRSKKHLPFLYLIPLPQSPLLLLQKQRGSGFIHNAHPLSVQKAV